MVVPSYFDPKYNCEMELLRFDSRRPNVKYAGLIELLRDRLANVSVIAGQAPLQRLALVGSEPQHVFAA
jgi:hypothetical protein